ncbi:MAG TPA: hypothetical protein VK841_16890 [Polyangiaceae bacterium]|jgi:starch phosphorylase|nr:hypothetical protein [Polyangiaceae bacterium]
MAQVTPRFSASRAVREYTDTYYAPAADRYRARFAEGGALGAELLRWQRDLERRLPEVRFNAFRADRDGPLLHFSVEVALGELDPAAVHVELYADAYGRGAAERHAMTSAKKTAPGRYTYVARIESARSAVDYTPRVVPWHSAASIPLEMNAIRWQR